MLGILDQILCWIKQIGALVLNSIIDFANILIDSFFIAINALIAAWPIEMPDMPTTPPQLITAIGWVRWTPLPVEAGLAFLAFLLGVYLLWFAAGIILRWAKVAR